MDKAKDWIKRNHVELHMQVNGTWEYISPARAPGRLVSWGYPEGSKVFVWINDTFLMTFVKYNNVYATWENPATRPPLQTRLLQRTEKELFPVYRQLHDIFKGNPFVLDNDLEAMGMPPRPTGGHTPVPPPKTIPTLEFEHPGTGVVEVHFRDKEVENKAKPHGVHGVELLYGLLDHVPESLDELTRSAFDTHTPCQLVFGFENVGKTLYIAARWESTRGDKGLWSNIYHELVS
jgi:hypothetical protein